MNTAVGRCAINCPLVTVITAVFNGRQHLASCIESVISQDYPNIEHLVLDGGSTDGTIDLIRHYHNRIAFWSSEPDEGVFDAWNKGLARARGEWICFLGADDEFLPGAVSAYMALALRNPDAEFLSSRAKLDHPSGYAPIFGAPWSWPQFVRAMTTVHVGSMHRKTMFERLGVFDASYRIAGDYELMLRAKAELKAAFMPDVSVVMRAGGLSDSTAGLYEARRAKLQNSVCSPLRATVDLFRLITRFYFRRAFLIIAPKVVRSSAG